MERNFVSWGRKGLAGYHNFRFWKDKSNQQLRVFDAKSIQDQCFLGNYLGRAAITDGSGRALSLP